ncbi:hypothetical protein Clacol_007587 [Clathrus columnatus]|uniref:Uncharacterized protein n=1 Tax=Clathrus columnatus TaxID=1419009 RepID=A0AAV5AG75_9AGAM|nr:hypothetical protein Clacol_007587 [Clathrus columnatus]
MSAASVTELAVPLKPPGESELPPNIPAPARRHGSPSGPWPWLDIDFSNTKGRTLSLPPSYIGQEFCPHGSDKGCEKECWIHYPESIFANWSELQVKKSRIKELSYIHPSCTIFNVDVGYDGTFSDTGRLIISSYSKEDQRPKNTRVRALFMENLSLPVMQILGTKYNIEPFFFSSSLNWIPSRYQEDEQPDVGDHITITLPFIRAKLIPPKSTRHSVRETNSTDSLADGDSVGSQTALVLRRGDPDIESQETLLLELLAVHMIRDRESSTLISYHAPYSSTSAEMLHKRVSLAGQSVYWQKIFKQSPDPTLVLLSIFWYPLYAWDESLATLWTYIGELEIGVLKSQNIEFTQTLYKIRAHVLYYVSLQEDFKNAIIFLRDTYNPMMGTYDDATKNITRKILQRECNNLLVEIGRLELSREMQEKRLQNVIDLAFSRHTQNLSEAALRDSAAMKQISYLTMVFLPASFAASAFGMNLDVLSQGTGTIPDYLATAIPLTLVTIWIMIALHESWHIKNDNEMPSFWARWLWPFVHAKELTEVCRKSILCKYSLD